VCYQKKWPLISADYRFLPQAKAEGLLEDISAAYYFAWTWRSDSRRVIVGGASAGFFLATLTAHHLTPKPLALLSITGISTFQHPFFSSSTLLTPKPLTDENMAPHLNMDGPIATRTAAGPTPFVLERLTSSGAKNTDYVPPKPEDEDARNGPGYSRGMLYDYYLYHNKFPVLVGSIDPGYGPVFVESGEEKKLAPGKEDWPPTVIIHGDDDYDVSMDVSEHMVNALGEERVSLFLAGGQGHLFEREWFLEDEEDAMGAVRDAVERLVAIVQGTS